MTVRARSRRDLVAIGLILGAMAGCGSGPRSGTTSSGLYWESSGRGSPVVLIHGFSLDRRMWEPQVPVISARHRVIRYDLRGHGRSAAVDGSYDPRADLAEVMDAAGLDDATLVGLSAGAQIAIDFALTRPERVERLVVASPGVSGYVPTGSFEWMMPVMAAAGTGHAEEAARLWAETPLMAVPQDAHGDSLMRVTVMENARLWTYRTNPETPMASPALGRLHEIHVPVLILVGEDDMADIRIAGDTLHTCIAGSTLRTVPAAGHLINLAAPPAFNRAVMDFLGTAADRPAGGPTGC